MHEKFIELGARALRRQSAVRIDDVRAVEKKISTNLPEELKLLLTEIGDAVLFDKSAVFKPRQASGFEDQNGFLPLDILYGIPEGRDGLIEMNNTFSDQFPDGLVVIGGASGGDQICIETSTRHILFWHHEASSIETSAFQIAPSFTDFVDLLEIEVENHDDNVNSKIVSSSFRF